MSNTYQISTDTKPVGQGVSAAADNVNRDFAEREIMQKAKDLGLGYIDLRLVMLNPDLVWQIDAEESEAALALPFFALGKKLRIGLVNPEKPETKEYLAKLTANRFELQLNLVSLTGLNEKLAEIRAAKPQIKPVIENRDAEIGITSFEEEITKLHALAQDVYHISAEEALNRIFVGALRARASDLHFQQTETELQLRFRIDGVLQDIFTCEVKTGSQIVDQLKYESKLRLNVKTIPQDGRTRFRVSGRNIDVRVSTLPTEYGESVVCRLLDSKRESVSLESLGFEAGSLARLRNSLTLRNGMVLVTGPTGSGKTTTLYTLLDLLNTPERKIATLEDPVEYHLPNIVQSQVDENAGYSFADGLRSLLRQDPDVVMLGEIRNKETAEVAAQAAMTGHIVLSTLHTNSAVETISRLINMGLRPFMVNASLALVVAQRLVRQVHTECARRVVPSEEQQKILAAYLQIIKKINPECQAETPEYLYEPGGCDSCSHTGYQGRVAVAESFEITPALRQLISREASADELAQQIRSEQKMLTFEEDGVLKVCAGTTTIAELLRVTGLTWVS